MKKKVEKKVEKETAVVADPAPEVELAPVLVTETPLEVAKKKAAKMIADAEANEKEQKDLDKEFKKSNIVIFVSRYKDHCLCMSPKIVKESRTGNNEIVSAGKKLQFRNCIYRTSDEKEIEFVKDHPAFGSTITLAVTSPEAVKEAVNERIKTQME